MVRNKHYNIIWDDLALNQLQDYLEYVYKQNPTAPRIIRDRILNKLKVLQTNPLICEDDRLKDNNDGTYKSFTVYSYRITYRIMENSIIRVRHSSKEPLGY